MPNTTGKTRAIIFRIPIDVYETVKRRAEKHPEKWASPQQYIKDRVIYDVRRKHEARVRTQ